MTQRDRIHRLEQAERDLERVEDERDSWRRVAERLEAEKQALATRLVDANADMLVAARNIREQAGEIRLLMGVADMLERSAGETHDQDQETR